MTRTQRCVAFLLKAAPRAFRARFEREYLATLGDRIAGFEGERSRRTAVFALREIAGAVVVVTRLRLGMETVRHSGAGRAGAMAIFDGLGRDVRLGARTLGRNPGFVFAAVGVLALGIGASTAIFSAVNAFLFRPLPFAEADRLVVLYETNPEFGWTHEQVAPANALDWRDQVDAFEDVAMYHDLGAQDIVLHQDGETVLVGGVSVTGNFFSVLGVQPRLGRSFRDGDTWAADAPVAMLSHRLWVERFGGDPDVLGRTVPLGGAVEGVEIVGVMPEGFTFPGDDTELWYPYAWAPEVRDQVWFRRAHFARAVGRLAPGVDLAEADAQLQVVVARLQTEYPATNSVMGAGFMPMRDFLIRGIRTPLLVLAGAVGLLLLLACANVANLLLVRANDRSREVALRHALGAGRGRVVRQFLVESLLLATAGGIAGLALGWFGVLAMSRLTRLGIDGATTVSLDGRVLVFTLLAAGVSGVLFGTLPAMQGARGDIHEALREGGRGSSRGRRGQAITRGLVVAEVALALLLVVGAGLMVRTSWSLRQVDPGFAVDGAIAMEFTVPEARYPERDQVLAFWDGFAEALEGRAGIERVGTVGSLPLTGPNWSSQFQAEGWPPDRVGQEILHRRADAGYFEALDIPLVRGRMFGPTDGPDDPLVVLVNESFASEHFPDEDPIGQKIAYDRAATPESTWYEIVGVVGDQNQEGLREPARAEVFENRDQDWSREVWVVLRTSVEPVSVMPTVRSVLAELDPQIPIADVWTLREVWRRSMSAERFLLTLLGTFGATALLLAAVGVYGVTAQAAKRRTQEIGIRMALGANASEVVSLMLRQGLAVIFVGLAVGLLAALLATRVLAGLLYGVEPTDPGTLLAVATILGSVAAFASYVPARRATAVNPVDSLRSE